MARDFSRALYKSKAWEEAREAVMRKHHGLCARCLERGYFVPAVIVHHKEHLNPDNVNDMNIALSHDNLEPLCRKCHAEEHPEIYSKKKAEEPKRYDFDAYGNLIRGRGNDDGR